MKIVQLFLPYAFQNSVYGLFRLQVSISVGFLLPTLLYKWYGNSYDKMTDVSEEYAKLLVKDI